MRSTGDALVFAWAMAMVFATVLILLMSAETEIETLEEENLALLKETDSLYSRLIDLQIRINLYQAVLGRSDDWRYYETNDYLDPGVHGWVLPGLHTWGWGVEQERREDHGGVPGW